MSASVLIADQVTVTGVRSAFATGTAATYGPIIVAAAFVAIWYFFKRQNRMLYIPYWFTALSFLVALEVAGEIVIQDSKSTALNNGLPIVIAATVALVVMRITLSVVITHLIDSLDPDKYSGEESELAEKLPRLRFEGLLAGSTIVVTAGVYIGMATLFKTSGSFWSQFGHIIELFIGLALAGAVDLIIIKVDQNRRRREAARLAAIKAQATADETAREFDRMSKRPLASSDEAVLADFSQQLSQMREAPEPPV